MMQMLWRYLMNYILFMDQFFNLIRGGDPGESISVAAAKARNQEVIWGCVLCKALGWILRTDHCSKALANFGKHSLWGD